MSTDRELLELAAKAAGLVIDWRGGWSGINNVAYVEGKEWNPLTDDGDALRLAVKLEIAWRKSPWHTGQAVTSSSCLMQEFWEPLDNDELAATRRAIVRAAAEIGKAMP